jgi:hypothetical protein
VAYSLEVFQISIFLIFRLSLSARAACPAYLIPFDLLKLSTNQPTKPLNMMPGYWHPVQLPNYLTSYLLTIDGGISGVMED